MGALTEEAADPVDAGGPVEAGRASAVVDVLAAVGSGPAVDAYAGVAAVAVGAGRPVVAGRGPHRALVHVVLALTPGERGRAQARVLVHPVDASRPVLTQVALAVVDVLLALITLETCELEKKKKTVSFSSAFGHRGVLIDRSIPVDRALESYFTER